MTTFTIVKVQGIYVKKSLQSIQGWEYKWELIRSFRLIAALSARRA